MKRFFVAAIASFLTFAALRGDESVDSKTPLAKINGESVSAAEVDAELRAAFGGKPLSDEDRARLKRAALDQVIDRRLVLAYLAKTGQAATKDDVDVELAQFDKDLKSQNLSLEQHSQRVGLSLDDIRRAL